MLFGCIFWSGTKWLFFPDIQSNQLSASTEAVRRRQNPFDPTQSNTPYLFSNHTIAFQLLQLPSSFWIKKEITRVSCCGLSWRPVIRRSDLLWQTCSSSCDSWSEYQYYYIHTAKQEAAFDYNGKSSFIHNINLKHEPKWTFRTGLYQRTRGCLHMRFL